MVEISKNVLALLVIGLIVIAVFGVYVAVQNPYVVEGYKYIQKQKSQETGIVKFVIQERHLVGTGKVILKIK